MERTGISRWLLALTFAVIAFGTSGCMTVDDDNLSERPWNAPKTWETGVPQGMMQGR